MHEELDNGALFDFSWDSMTLRKKLWDSKAHPLKGILMFTVYCKWHINVITFWNGISICIHICLRFKQAADYKKWMTLWNSVSANHRFKPTNRLNWKKEQDGGGHPGNENGWRGAAFFTFPGAFMQTLHRFFCCLVAFVNPVFLFHWNRTSPHVCRTATSLVMSQRGQGLLRVSTNFTVIVHMSGRTSFYHWSICVLNYYQWQTVDLVDVWKIWDEYSSKLMLF